MRLGGEVDDRVAARGGGLDRLARDDVPLDRLADAGEIVPLGRVRQLVEDDDLVPCGKEPLDEVAADEAAAAGDEHAHRLGL